MAKTTVSNEIICQIEAEKAAVTAAAEKFVKAKAAQDAANNKTAKDTWENSPEGQDFINAIGKDKALKAETTLGAIRNFFLGDRGKPIYARATHTEFNQTVYLNDADRGVRTAQQELLAAQTKLHDTMFKNFGTRANRMASENANLLEAGKTVASGFGLTNVVGRVLGNFGSILGGGAPERFTERKVDFKLNDPKTWLPGVDDKRLFFEYYMKEESTKCGGGVRGLVMTPFVFVGNVLTGNLRDAFLTVVQAIVSAVYLVGDIARALANIVSTPVVMAANVVKTAYLVGSKAVRGLALAVGTVTSPLLYAATFGYFGGKGALTAPTADFSLEAHGVTKEQVEQATAEATAVDAAIEKNLEAKNSQKEAYDKTLNERRPYTIFGKKSKVEAAIAGRKAGLESLQKQDDAAIENNSAAARLAKEAYDEAIKNKKSPAEAAIARRKAGLESLQKQDDAIKNNPAAARLAKEVFNKARQDGKSEVEAAIAGRKAGLESLQKQKADIEARNVAAAASENEAYARAAAPLAMETPPPAPPPEPTTPAAPPTTPPPKPPKPAVAPPNPPTGPAPAAAGATEYQSVRTETEPDPDSSNIPFSVDEQEMMNDAERRSNASDEAGIDEESPEPGDENYEESRAAPPPPPEPELFEDGGNDGYETEEDENESFTRNGVTDFAPSPVEEEREEEREEDDFGLATLFEDAAAAAAATEFADENPATTEANAFKPTNYRAIEFNIGGKSVEIGGMARPSFSGQDPKQACEFLKKEGYTTLISLDYEQKNDKIATDAGLTYVNQNVLDFTAPSIEQLDQIYDNINNCVAGGGKPAIHCGEGFGRTGTVLAAIKLKELMLAAPMDELDNQEMSESVHLGHYGGNKSVLCTPMVKQAIELVRACQGSGNSVENQLQVDQLCKYGDHILKQKLQASPSTPIPTTPMGNSSEAFEELERHNQQNSENNTTPDMSGLPSPESPRGRAS